MPRLLQNEGLYSNVPADRGGETYAGITRLYNPEWRGWAIIDGQEQTTWDELKEAVYDFYETKYKHLRLDEFDGLFPELAYYLFDTATLFGSRRMVEWTQQGLNALIEYRTKTTVPYQKLIVDGHIGPKTTAAIMSLRKSRSEPQALMALLVMKRIGYHTYKVESEKDQGIFYIGWLARAIRLG